MKIYVTVKSVGKRKPYLEKKEYILSSAPCTLKDLITEIVAYHVRQYNERKEDRGLLSFLTEEEISARGAEGKVGFGARYDERNANGEQAVQTAILAFQDGLYRVFIRGEEAVDLDAGIEMNDGDDVAFIKFTMLAGQLW